MKLSTLSGIAISIASLFLLTSCSNSQIRSSSDAQTITVNGKIYNLEWNDEFNGTKLDTSKWGYRLGNRRTGFWVEDAVRLDGKGNLNLVTYEKDGQHYSGAIETFKTYMTRYGYFEIRCKLNNKEGHWPSFWIQTPTFRKFQNDPGKGGAEIDIMEYWVQSPEKIHNSVHWNGLDDELNTRTKASDIPNLNKGFHTIGLEWTPNEYIFYVDGKEIFRVEEGISHIEEFMILSDEWPGEITKTKLPDKFIVDYVRVYKAEK
ncbi:MAG: glycoside hydrolase family 16 protein [Planctomycetaceae bacterium]|nr:glycoside hydrolase family 16 protein [Planctomycetaceae bacterium]